jgi:hypothetical protein
VNGDLHAISEGRITRTGAPAIVREPDDDEWGKPPTEAAILARAISFPLEGYMAEKFIVVWTIDGETMSMPHSTQDEALQQAETLLREHGCNLEITLHLDRISPPLSIWFNKKRMQQWCLDGFPIVQI